MSYIKVSLSKNDVISLPVALWSFFFSELLGSSDFLFYLCTVHLDAPTFLFAQLVFMTATTTIPLEGIMTFLNSMKLSTQNKKWLGENLIKQALQEQSQMETEKEHTHIIKGLDAALKEAKQIREGKLQGRPLTELLDEI